MGVVPSPAIEVSRLTKRYGDVTAVSDLSFRVEPGVVTGFLGPNGAGKSTTLRMVLGLVTPTSGTATVLGKPYRELTDPVRAVGAALEATAYHPGRTGQWHLRWMAEAGGIPLSRVGEVLRLVELDQSADRRVGGYSLGMRQRLALAGALLGDPQVLVLDEPANGLDPQGMRWLRDRLRALAAEGRAVLVSSHVLAEVAQTVDEVVVIDHGRFVTQAPLEELTGTGVGAVVRLRSPRANDLAFVLDAAGGDVRQAPDGAMLVAGLPQERIGDLAAEHGIPLHELGEWQSSLEDRFLELTGGIQG